MKYIKSEIIRLPTKDHSNTVKIGGKMHFNESLAFPYKRDDEAFALYFLSNEEIKVGDVVLHDFGMGFEIENPCDVDNLKSNTRFKIIATTDKKLNMSGIAKPSKEFLKKYCELGGIKEVLVEYEYNHDDTVPYPKTVEGEMWKLKVSPDNTITTKLIKENWSKEEVESILFQFAIDCGMDEDLYSHYNGDYKGLDNWIKENL